MEIKKNNVKYLAIVALLFFGASIYCASEAGLYGWSTLGFSFIGCFFDNLQRTLLK